MTVFDSSQCSLNSYVEKFSLSFEKLLLCWLHSSTSVNPEICVYRTSPWLLTALKVVKTINAFSSLLPPLRDSGSDVYSRLFFFSEWLPSSLQCFYTKEHSDELGLKRCSRVWRVSVLCAVWILKLVCTENLKVEMDFSWRVSISLLSLTWAVSINDSYCLCIPLRNLPWFIVCRGLCMHNSLQLVPFDGRLCAWLLL